VQLQLHQPAHMQLGVRFQGVDGEQGPSRLANFIWISGRAFVEPSSARSAAS